eukprot:TRINITY_DN1446_c0_g1_i15.p1 TRINITY_DN1446_c0_g1~~TRINITY_DN1446_c0_g1_i15.p1  ORF type:complete len:590 (-),score=77.74 TRINITY_DN1446_c0_g1_i15:550-2319(-)
MLQILNYRETDNFGENKQSFPLKKMEPPVDESVDSSVEENENTLLVTKTKRYLFSTMWKQAFKKLRSFYVQGVDNKELDVIQLISDSYVLATYKGMTQSFAVIHLEKNDLNEVQLPTHHLKALSVSYPYVITLQCLDLSAKNLDLETSFVCIHNIIDDRQQVIQFAFEEDPVDPGTNVLQTNTTLLLSSPKRVVVVTDTKVFKADIAKSLRFKEIKFKTSYQPPRNLKKKFSVLNGDLLILGSTHSYQIWNVVTGVLLFAGELAEAISLLSYDNDVIIFSSFKSLNMINLVNGNTVKINHNCITAITIHSNTVIVSDVNRLITVYSKISDAPLSRLNIAKNNESNGDDIEKLKNGGYFCLFAFDNYLLSGSAKGFQIWQLNVKDQPSPVDNVKTKGPVINIAPVTSNIMPSLTGSHKSTDAYFFHVVNSNNQHEFIKWESKLKKTDLENGSSSGHLSPLNSSNSTNPIATSSSSSTVPETVSNDSPSPTVLKLDVPKTIKKSRSSNSLSSTSSSNSPKSSESEPVIKNLSGSPALSIKATTIPLDSYQPGKFHNTTLNSRSSLVTCFSSKNRLSDDPHESNYCTFRYQL